MNQNKKIIQVVVSLLSALLFVNFYLKSKEQNIENAYGMVEVLAAARDIPPQTALGGEHLVVKQIPMKFVEPGAILVKEPEQAYRRVIGKVTIAGVTAGAQIVQTNLNAPSLDKTGIAPRIPPGKRGYLLRLGNLDVAQLIIPGNYIDVMATFSVKDGDKATKATYTILQNILVVGVGRDLRRENEEVSPKKENAESLVLTLAVDPSEAQRLELARSESQGEISVVVRPPGDNKILPVPVATPGKLLGG